MLTFVLLLITGACVCAADIFPGLFENYRDGEMAQCYVLEKKFSTVGGWVVDVCMVDVSVFVKIIRTVDEKNSTVASGIVNVNDQCAAYHWLLMTNEPIVPCRWLLRKSGEYIVPPIHTSIYDMVSERFEYPVEGDDWFIFLMKTTLFYSAFRVLDVSGAFILLIFVYYFFGPRKLRSEPPQQKDQLPIPETDSTKKQRDDPPGNSDDIPPGST